MPKASLLARLFRRTVSPAAQRLTLASAVTESNVSQGANWNALYRDRYDYDRQKVLDEALLAWRLNPLCRRIVEIQTQYITDGIEFHCDDPRTEQFLTDFWNHPLNKIGEHLKEWADELALTGNLFPILTTDRAGMSYLRIFPTDQIAEIETRPNDVQQEVSYLPKTTAADPEPKRIPAFRIQNSEFRFLKSRTIMLHYAVNRLAGMLWGEPDIAPLLPWLARYASWLEDRVRLNRFRQAFLYVVKGSYTSEAEKEARRKQIMMNPPQPGAVMVVDQSEEWTVLDPKLDSFDANADGLALKKFIAGGRGLPLHWLSEPESSTRTTAEAAGTPTFKGLESRQRVFLSMLKDILQVVVERAAQRGASVDLSALITVDAADISERDNAALALASTEVVSSFGQLWANGFIDANEYLRIVYRFAGEVMPSARPDSPRTQPQSPAASADGITIGEARAKEPQE